MEKIPIFAANLEAVFKHLMSMKRKLFFLSAFTMIIALNATPLSACTSAIISGRITPDGRPLLWKHRDTDCLDNRVDYIEKDKDIKYAFVAVVSATTSGGTSWMGTNEAGFSIINTASRNMHRYDEDSKDGEGRIMYKALACCRNLADFEAFLNANKPLCVQTNFGVIDAQGGAAYYETNSYEWTKVDVNDPTAAPLGYKVYTNFSHSGTPDGGGGYIRYANANETLEQFVLGNGKVTPEWMFDNLSRSFNQPLVGINLVKNPELAPSGWYYDMDFIPRKSTASAAVIKGVKAGENPLLSTMWVVLGYPPVSVAVPVMVAAGKDQPSVTSRISAENGHCPISDAAMKRRAEVFPIKRGSGPHYLHFSVVYNTQGTGYMQMLAPVEAEIFKRFEAMQNGWYESGEVRISELKHFYRKADFGLDAGI